MKPVPDMGISYAAVRRQKDLLGYSALATRAGPASSVGLRRPFSFTYHKKNAGAPGWE